MAADYLCIPGLQRPVSLSDYAKLEGLREADVLATIGQLKIPAAYFRGQWFVEAPPNCEARLAQVRSDKAGTTKKGSLVEWVRELAREHNQAPSEPERAHPEAPPEPYPVVETRGYRLSELPRAARIDQRVHLAQPSAAGHDPRRVDVLEYPQPPQPASDTQENIGRESEVERLRVQFVTSHWRYDRLTTHQQEALLNTTKYAERPQPIDYGLSRYDICIHTHRYPLNDDLKYREEQSHEWRWIFLVAFGLYACACGGLLYLQGSGQLNWTTSQLWQLALGLVPLSLIGSTMLFGLVNDYRRRRSRPGYVRYKEALELHELYQTTAQKAVHEAEQATLRKKHSYWAFLDGYEFERATAEVMQKHHFTAMVTPGSGDGGVDIQVTRNGLKGVVQCKAHVACAGPHVVRDLYGVIHHCRADFGIIVSRGGFTRGAHDFRRDKPIHFLDTDDLIAMQEGRDVLASAFSRNDTPMANAQEGKETRHDRAATLGDYCRFEPTKTSMTFWHMWEKGLIDLAAGDIVKVVTTPKDRMCHVNKPGKWPVLVTMQLITPEWLEPINGNFKECDYCGAIDHETSECPYRGKVPYGRKGNFSWRIEDGKTILE